jgi:hypothetical protein
MANAGGQVGWDDVTVIGKKGPRSGTTLRSQQDIAAAQRKGLAVETEKKCNKYFFYFIFFINGNLGIFDCFYSL